MKVTQALQQLIEKKNKTEDTHPLTKTHWREVRRELQLFMEQGEDMDYDTFLDIVYYLAKHELDMSVNRDG